MSRRLLLVALLLAVPRVAAAQILWQFDESSASVDGGGNKLYGWDTRWGSIGTEYTDAQQVGGGPNGGDSVLFTYIEWADQVYAGGEKTISAPAYGSTRFVRGRLKYTVGSLSDIHTQKLLIIADPATDNRPILTIGTHLSAPNILRMALQLDGGVNPVTSGGLPTATWIHWQIEVYPGDSEVAANGYYKFWVATSGSMTYASPIGTQSSVAFTDVQRGQQGNYRMGFFMNDEKLAGDTWTIEFADWEVATTFDANWPTSGGGGGSAGPYRFRFRAAAADGALALGCVASVLVLGALRPRRMT